MSYAVIATKIDPQTKKEAQKTAAELGMPLSVIIKAFLKQFIKDKEVTFSAVSYQMTPYLEKVLARVEADRKAGKNFDGPFTTTQELKDYFASLRK